ncbi:MerR family DNA-binding transcriptional regulator [Dactylosporangium sp. NPDC049140]|uniref:MerR family DNA-binding transcriptional regulator n=1 Tax=Dactylosporangium sp. NPDC049140 TaxID=3155647 RepID=UPI00340E36FB
MRVGELARRSGTTIRALRYYESLGLVVPRRTANGYREYDSVAERLVVQIRELTALGLSVEETRPFVESLAAGADESDVCAAALATYRGAISGLQSRIGQLTAQREALEERLALVRVAEFAGPAAEPADLVGRELPDVEIFATNGEAVNFGRLGPGRTILFVYPLTGRPGVDLPDGLLEIPGARGGTEQARWFRDHHGELLVAGAARVYGLSAQSLGYQQELAHRLRLPYPLIPDPRLTLAAALALPTFEQGGMTLYRRVTLIVSEGRVEHVFDPIPAPSTHANEVLRWLNRSRAPR